ncbi:hypothetical protein CE457_15885 [Vreelandella boliviensis LC1]|uniref:Transposase DDE domain-containing protein n=1 Tax=Vreelandella boliviensis LC1 TaxID=1072583 RepID=A0ABX4G6F4_9GAMM|nr:hypothetical protein CE457_15885 [Halomonas boliviensis LC1]
MRLKRCSNKCCWCATNKACWVTSSLPSAAASHRSGAGRQVSFIIDNNRLPNYVDWMKHRVDSPKGKEIYRHRMSVVEPVFN